MSTTLLPAMPLPMRSRSRAPRALRATVTTATLLAAGLLGLAGCRDAASPSGDEHYPSSVVTAVAAPAGARVDALVRDTPLAQDLTRSWTIGASGGTIVWAEVGLRVVVPAGAVSGPTTFTVTALKGRIVAYDFGPSGAVFAKDVLVQQNVAGTNYYRHGNPERVIGGYFRGPGQLDDASSGAAVNETLSTWPEQEADGYYVCFTVRHFSGYIVCWG